MHLYVVYFDGGSHIYSGDGSFHNDECRGVYATMDDAIEFVLQEQRHYQGPWIAYSNDRWKCRSTTCYISTIMVQDDTNEVWMIFRCDQVQGRGSFATEEEARAHLFDMMVTTDDWNETSHNRWACEHYRCYIKRFDIVSGTPIKEPVED
jgi:hypothetical protein